MAEGKSKRATIREVAQQCGVSIATVSYVLNDGPRPVLQSTRERVQQAIAELNFRPSNHARGLKGMPTDVFGVVFPDIIDAPLEDVYFSTVLTGVLNGAAAQGKACMLFTGIGWQQADHDIPLKCEAHCDGLILLGFHPESKLMQNLISRSVSFVVVASRPKDLAVNFVDIDNFDGGKMATEHLIALGHRRIAMFGQDDIASWARERYLGYCKAMEDCGYPVEPSLVAPRGSADSEAYDLAVEMFREPASRPTAVFCGNDSIAFSVLQALRALNLKVPEDVSVVGFDDIDARTTQEGIGLTTIRQPIRQIGSEAVRFLFEVVADPGVEPSERIYPVQLIVRHSTAPPTTSIRQGPHPEISGDPAATANSSSREVSMSETPPCP